MLTWILYFSIESSNFFSFLAVFTSLLSGLRDLFLVPDLLAALFAKMLQFIVDSQGLLSLLVFLSLTLYLEISPFSLLLSFSTTWYSEILRLNIRNYYLLCFFKFIINSFLGNVVLIPGLFQLLSELADCRLVLFVLGLSHVEFFG